MPWFWEFILGWVMGVISVEVLLWFSYREASIVTLIRKAILRGRG